MDQPNPVDFEEVINDDILHLIFNYSTIKELLPLMDVNQRWKDVCIHHLKTRTRFNGDDLNDDLPPNQTKEIHETNSNLFAKVKKMLKLMSGLKSFEFDFRSINEKNRMTLIETIINNNPLIEEFKLKWINKECLENMIKNIGTNIKILHLSYSDLRTKIGRSPFEGLPNLEELKLTNCIIISEMFKWIPATMKKLIFYGYSGQSMNREVIEAVIDSNNSSSIEDLAINDLSSDTFELICENFKNLKSIQFRFHIIFDPQNIRKLKSLKKLTSIDFR